MRGALILIFLSFGLCVQSLKILGIFPMASYSHYELGSALFKELASRGHELTVIAPYAEKTSIKNFKTIFLDGFKEEMAKNQKEFNMFTAPALPFVFQYYFVHSMGYKITENTFKHPNVQKLLKSTETFDLVIIEQFVNEAMVAFCHRYQAPCIKFSTFGSSYWTNSLVGNPSNPSYVAEMILQEVPPLNLWGRLKNTLYYIYAQLYYNIIVMTTHDTLMRTYFPGIPSIRELNTKIDLVLLNSHFTTSQATPHVPNMIEIGGLHIKPAKKLPEHLQKYLDNSKNGVVYFSMGSNLKSKDMPVEKREEILKVFSKLNMNVLWKFEEENLPNKPTNMMIQQWVPQQDILAHPNVKLFISHGGLLSTSEAIYNGVPVVGIPIFGDQWMNMLKAQSSGFGVPLKFNNLTEISLSWAINEILNNNIYAENAKRLSKIYHDRPMKPLDTAVFWTEYIGRHKGAKHMRSASMDLAWYQYHLLDVGLIFLLSTLAIIYGILYFCRKFCGRNKTKCTKKNKKENSKNAEKKNK